MYTQKPLFEQKISPKMGIDEEVRRIDPKREGQ